MRLAYITTGVVVCAIVMCAFSEVPTATPTTRLTTQPRILFLDAITAGDAARDLAEKIVSQYDPKSKALGEEELSAMQYLGYIRSTNAIEPLLRCVEVMSERPRGAGINDPDEMMETALDKMMPLHRYPAAQTLRAIGLPAVNAILDDVRKSPVSEKRLAIYVGIIESVLGERHAEAYVKRERDMADPKEQKKFDDMLQKLHSYKAVLLGVNRIPQK